MAIPIIGFGGTVMEVDPTLRAQRVAMYQPEGEFYTVRATTGVLAAVLAADAPLFAMRHGPSAVKHAYIHKIDMGFSVVVAYTATQQFGIYAERFSVAALAGGTTNTTMPFDTSDSSEVADIRVSTTAALTSAGVTFHGGKVPMFSWSTKAIDAQVGPITVFDASETAPIRLRPGEGMSLRNLIVWPAAGTGVFHCRVTWREA